MPVVRLFAQAREALGTSSLRLDGATVDELVGELCRRAGSSAGVVEVSRVYLNGEPAAGPESVSEDDEVAVLPPVSGG